MTDETKAAGMAAAIEELRNSDSCPLGRVVLLYGGRLCDHVENLITLYHGDKAKETEVLALGAQSKTMKPVVGSACVDQGSVKKQLEPWKQFMEKVVNIRAEVSEGFITRHSELFDGVEVKCQDQMQVVETAIWSQVMTALTAAMGLLQKHVDSEKAPTDKQVEEMKKNVMPLTSAS